MSYTPRRPNKSQTGNSGYHPKSNSHSSSMSSDDKLDLILSKVASLEKRITALEDTSFSCDSGSDYGGMHLQKSSHSNSGSLVKISNEVKQLVSRISGVEKNVISLDNQMMSVKTEVAELAEQGEDINDDYRRGVMKTYVEGKQAQISQGKSTKGSLHGRGGVWVYNDEDGTY